MINPADSSFVQPDRDEVGQPAILVDHAERTVPGVDQRHRRLDDPAEYRLESQVAAYRDNGLEESVHPVARVQHGLHPALQLGEQII